MCIFVSNCVKYFAVYFGRVDLVYYTVYYYSNIYVIKSISHSSWSQNIRKINKNVSKKKSLQV